MCTATKPDALPTPRRIGPKANEESLLLVVMDSSHTASKNPVGKKTSCVQFACSQNKQVALSIKLQTVALQFLALLKNWRQCLANQGSATSSASSWRAAFLSWPPYDAARGAAYKNFWPAPGPLQPLLLRRRTNFGALRVQNVNAASAAQRKQ